MPYLIDGHNLIGKMPDIDLSDPDDERALVGRLRAHCARARKRATVVFDHGQPAGRSWALSRGAVQVVFAAHSQTADDLILNRVKRARDPHGLIVVTSDRALADAVRAHGAQVRSAEAFAAQLNGPTPHTNDKNQERPLSEKEIEEWLRLFGEKD